MRRFGNSWKNVKFFLFTLYIIFIFIFIYNHFMYNHFHLPPNVISTDKALLQRSCHFHTTTPPVICGSKTISPSNSDGGAEGQSQPDSPMWPCPTRACARSHAYPSRSLTITASRHPFRAAARADLTGAAPPPRRRRKGVVAPPPHRTPQQPGEEGHHQRHCRWRFARLTLGQGAPAPPLLDPTRES